MRQAELVAGKHVHPESRPSFVQSVRHKVGEGFDADQAVDGSYDVQMRDARGGEHVQWGAGPSAVP